MSKTMHLMLWLALLFAPLAAEPLSTLVSVDDGLATEDPATITDDYIRLTLTVADYQQANNIRQAVERWLGPDMVTVRDAQSVWVQAPRAPTERVAFIAALLVLDIETPD